MADVSACRVTQYRRLLPELLLIVFEYLETSRQDLFNCSLCSKEWSSPAQNALYRHLYLTEANIARFCDRNTWRAPHMQSVVRTLTIRIKEHDIRYHNSVAIFETFGARVAEMVNLKSLSYHGCARMLELNFLPRALLSSVPRTCVALEIEKDETWGSGREQHICSDVRQHLPQLHHLRVRWPMLCLDLFGRSPDDRVCAEHLETCVINAVGADHDVVGLCVSSDSRINVVKMLLDSISDRLKSGTLGRPKKVLVVDGRKRRFYGDQSVWSKLSRRDFINNKAYIMPYSLNRDIVDQGLMLRLPEDEGGDCVGKDLDALLEMVETRVWQATPEGVRLPASLMEQFRLSAILPVISRSDWSESSEPRYKFQIWKREEECGLRLVNIKEGNMWHDASINEIRRPNQT